MFRAKLIKGDEFGSKVFVFGVVLKFWVVLGGYPNPKFSSSLVYLSVPAKPVTELQLGTGKTKIQYFSQNL